MVVSPLPRVGFGLVGLAAALISPQARAGETAGVRWRADYQAARAEAQEKGLPLLLEIGTEACVYCKKQDATTFRDPDVVDLVNRRFVPLRVDGAGNQPLVQALSVQMFPTTVLAGPDGKIHGFLQGYVSADDLRAHAGRAVAAVARPAQARDLVAAAREEFRGHRFADCLDKCDLVAARFADLPEAKAAAALAAQVKGDPDRLAAACDRAADRTAGLYLTLADAWAAKGQPKEAQACLEKVVRLSPASPAAEVAKARLTALHKADGAPAIQAVFEKR